MKKEFAVVVLLLFFKFGYAQTAIDSLNVNPNPFCSATKIHFDITNNDTVTLTVYDVFGKLIKVFYSNTLLSSGSYSVNLIGDSINDGIYFLQWQYGINKTKNSKVIKQCSVNAISDAKTKNQKIILFPNPANDLLTVPIDGIKTIVITNLLGQICKQIKTDTKSISLVGLKNGNYIVTVYNNKNVFITSERIIKE